MVTPVAMEPLLGYHPCSIGFLTRGREPVWGQCQVGSLTGAVASERVSEMCIRDRVYASTWLTFLYRYNLINLILGEMCIRDRCPGTGLCP